MPRTPSEWLAYADSMLLDNGLQGWTAREFSGRSTVGQCDYSTRTINLSSAMLNNSPESYIIDTIIHEVSHALTPGDGHGDEWRVKAIGLGGSGSKYASKDETGKLNPKWVLVCECGDEFHLFRFTYRRVYYCNRCMKPYYVINRDGNFHKIPKGYVDSFNYIASVKSMFPIDEYGVITQP